MSEESWLTVSERAAHPPAVRGPALLTDAGLIHEPEGNLLVGMGVGGRLHGIEKPLFAKASRAIGSAFGCVGRAFCRDRPRRRSSLLMCPG